MVREIDEDKVKSESCLLVASNRIINRVGFREKRKRKRVISNVVAKKQNRDKNRPPIPIDSLS